MYLLDLLEEKTKMNASQMKKMLQQTDGSVSTEMSDETDIEELLKTLNVSNTEYLEDKTLEDINKEVLDILTEYKIKTKEKKEFCKKLIGYRFVDDIYDLHIGKSVKIIRIKDSYQSPVSDFPLTCYGKVLTIKFTDHGTNILCKLPYGNKMLQYRYDNFLTFQQLTPEEQIILMANKNLQEVIDHLDDSEETESEDSDISQKIN